MVKKEKMMMGNDGGGGRDLISELPEPILLHILSFLDMTYVIQTSLLSKRWRYIWASLSILNFDYKVYDTWFEKEFFPFFVTQVLIFRNHNSNIDCFRVSYRNKNDHTIMNHVSAWMHLLIRSNVKLIDFHVALNHLEFVPQFPTCLFTCKSLTTLKLYNGGHMFRPQSTGYTVSLPSVKTLHLKSLNLCDPVEMLISRSPVLETLIIDTCHLWESKKFTISNAQLKSLVIERMYVGESGDDELYDQGRVDVFAPKLESFTSKDVFKNINRYSFVNVPSLVHAELDADFDLDVYVTAKNEESIENVIWCLRGIYNVKSLILSVWLLELAIEVPKSLEGLQIRPFHNLSYLQLKTSFSKNHACAIMFLLGKCPNLVTLVLKVTKVKSVSVKEEGFWEAELVPQCNMHHLKLVEIRDVLASVNELEFLKFLLKNATGLEKMVVFTPKGQFPENDKRFKGFGEKLISFRGASSSAQIVFV